MEAPPALALGCPSRGGAMLGTAASPLAACPPHALALPQHKNPENLLSSIAL